MTNENIPEFEATQWDFPYPYPYAYLTFLGRSDIPLYSTVLKVRDKETETEVFRRAWGFAEKHGGSFVKGIRDDSEDYGPEDYSDDDVERLMPWE